MKKLLTIIVLFALLGLPALCSASITTFSGVDDGVYPGPWPNSAMAQSDFIAAAGAFGPLNTITFENLPTGFYSPFTAAPGVTVTISAPNNGPDFSGIVDHPYPSYPALYGFNTTPNGQKWFGFPGYNGETGLAIFNFTVPTHSFGMYLTGLQTAWTSSVLEVFNDGASEMLSLPITVSGGAEYYGFTDTSPFSSIIIMNIPNDGYWDAWGIDDVTYNVIPVPPALWLFGSGLVGLLGLRRFRKY